MDRVADGTPAAVGGAPADGRRSWQLSLNGLDRRSETVAFVGLIALSVAPMIAATASLVGRHWHPASDLAIQLLQIDDVGGRHTPLTGAHSRYGWDHPGPLLFWLLAPFDWLFGATGALLGVAALNTAAIVGALFVARRRGGLTLTALVATVLLVLVLANDTDLFVNPWNPWVAVLPFFTYLLLAWSLAEGELGAMPWMVGVGTFIVQAHVGYALLVLGAAVTAGLLTWRSPGGRNGHGPVRRSVVLSLVIGVALWLPPIAQQLFGDRGNLSAMVEFFRHPSEAPAGWRLAWGIMGRELGPPGTWLAGDELGPFGVRPGSAVPAVVLLVVVVAVGAVAWRRGSTSAGTLALITLVLCAVGVVSTSRITGLIGTYLVRWWWVLAAAIWLSIGWSATCLVTDRRARQALFGTAVAATVALSAVVTVRAVPAGVPDATQSAAVGALAGELTTRLDRDAVYAVDWTDSELWGAVGIGVFVELERRGYSVVVPPERAAVFGSWRSAGGGEVDATLLVVGAADAAEGFRPPPGAVEMARFDSAGGEDYAIYLDS